MRGQAVPGGGASIVPAMSTAGGSEATGQAIEVFGLEERTFPPPTRLAASANLADPGVYDEAAADPEAFWARQARELLTWRKDFHTTLEWEPPFAKWFVGGEL